MGFFDRFKPQPKWKHPDRVVRTAAVEALPDDQQDVLEAVATTDPDADVRRVAVARLGSVARLAGIANDDADERVRADAREVLLELAQDSTDPAEAEQAIAALAGQRELAIVARTAELERAALAALARLDDPKVVAVVARQAGHAAVRLAALERLSTPDDWLGVAIKSEHKDVALAALSRLDDPAALETVAVRARSKMVGRRARARLRALEVERREPEQAALAARRRAQVCEAVEALAAGDVDRLTERLVVAEAEWVELAEQAAPDERARFDAAVGRVRERLAMDEAARAEHERRGQELAAEITQAAASRVALCERIEALSGTAAAGSLDEARTIWVALMPWPEAARESAQAQQIEERFERACAECERRIEQARAREQREAALRSLLRQAQEAVDVPDLGAARQGWQAARQSWQAAGAGNDPGDAPLVDEFRRLEARLGARDAEAREARAREARHNLSRLEELTAQVERLAAVEELSMKEADRVVRDVKAALGHPGPLPSREDQERVLGRLREVANGLFARVQELRESEEWRRWANAGIQEELCVQAEKLADVEDGAELARQLRDLQQRWKKAGVAPRDKAEPLWIRFKAACDAAWARCEPFLSEVRAAEEANLARKEQICLEAESLAESTDWIRTSEQLKALQAEWQKIGPVPREQGQVLWQRFRAACDRFFTRRKQDLTERKHEWAANLARKEAICAEAEHLAQSTDWAAASGELKRLQAEWKAVGPVKRNKSDAIWQRFRAACDTFFERYKHRDQIELGDHLRVREAICDSLEALVPADAADPTAAWPDNIVETVLDRCQQWHQAPRLPRTVLETVDERFGRALAAVLAAAPDRFRGTRLDVESSRRRMEQLCEQVESYLAGRVTTSDLAAAPATTLAAMLKDALAANTIGGRVDEETKWRAAVAAVRDAQSAWRRVGPVPGAEGRALAQRFERACRRFFELRAPHSAPASRGSEKPTHA